MGAELPELGEVVKERYRLVSVRAKGASSLLFEAEDVRDGQRLALKVLRPEVLAVPGITVRFEQEGRLLATLRSVHVVRVLDVGRTANDLPFLALELLEGNDLGAEIARRRVPHALAVHWIRQACQGVEEAHARGIVHRDVKPANLFLTRAEQGAGSIKVLDFGISKESAAESELTSFGAALGTPVYMPPEQLRSARDADARCDVWALGVVLYELIAGRAPFEGEGAHDVAAEILSDDVAPPLRTFAPDVPDGLSAVVERALQKDPALRIQTVRELRGALAPFDGMRSVAPPPAPPPPPASSIPPPLVAAPLDPRSSTAPQPMKRSTFWLAASLGLSIGSLVIVIAILGYRRLRGDTSSPLEAAGVVKPEPTVGSVLGEMAPTDGGWKPCLLAAKAEAASFPALSHPGTQPEPVADLDPLLEKKPMLRLDVPWQKGTASSSELSLTPITPLGRAFRDRPPRVIAITTAGLWRASIDDDAWERIGSASEISGLERALPAWIVLVEGDTRIRALAEALRRLDDARAPVALAIVKRDPPVAGSDAKAHACPGVRWRGTIVPQERAAIDAAMQELAKRCASAVPGMAGTSMEIVLRRSAAQGSEACIERREGSSIRLENCVIQGAKSVAIGGAGERAGAFRMTFEVEQVRPTCAE